MIFEAFTQADSSTTRKLRRHWPGLAISSQLVEMMGGRMWVESETGPGQPLPFHHPVRPALDAPVQPAPVPVNLKDLPVLAVDDNATNRRILEEFLVRWEMKPVLADGARAPSPSCARRDAGRPFRWCCSTP